MYYMTFVQIRSTMATDSQELDGVVQVFETDKKSLVGLDDKPGEFEACHHRSVGGLVSPEAKKSLKTGPNKYINGRS